MATKPQVMTKGANQMSGPPNHTPEIKSNLKSKRLWIPDEITIPGWIVFGMRGISNGAQLCYILLRGYAKGKDRAFPSVALMALQLGVSRIQIMHYTSELRVAGLIETKRRRGRSAVYVFQPLKIRSSFQDFLKSTKPPPGIKSKSKRAAGATYTTKATSKRFTVLPGGKVKP